MSSHWMMEHGLWLTLHKHQELSRLGFVLRSWVVSSHIIAYQYSVRLSGQPSVDPWSSISVQLLYLYAILCLAISNPFAFPQLWSQLNENAVGLSGFFLNWARQLSLDITEAFIGFTWLILFSLRNHSWSITLYILSIFLVVWGGGIICYSNMVRGRSPNTLTLKSNIIF